MLSVCCPRKLDDGTNASARTLELFRCFGDLSNDSCETIEFHSVWQISTNLWFPSRPWETAFVTTNPASLAINFSTAKHWSSSINSFTAQLDELHHAPWCPMKPHDAPCNDAMTRDDACLSICLSISAIHAVGGVCRQDKLLRLLFLVPRFALHWRALAHPGLVWRGKWGATYMVWDLQWIRSEYAFLSNCSHSACM